MTIADRLYRILLTRKPDKQKTIVQKNAVVLSGTTRPIVGKLHKSDSPPEQNPNGRTGNDHRSPTPERMIVGKDPGDRLQDIANSHLSEGSTPGRIWRPYNDRNTGHTGKGLSNRYGQNVGLLLNITGSPDGGLGDAKYMQHQRVIRPAGKATGSLRTINDGAQIPGVFISDTSRR